jgi:argininosuccinate lyase
VSSPGTGRLASELGRRSQRVIYGAPTTDELSAELSLMSRIDQAHLVMLAERGLIPASAAAGILRCVGELAEQSFLPLLSRRMPRGVYLMYEGYLIDRLGPDIGGMLHTGRSRNDLKATMTLLRLRGWLIEAAEQLVRLEAILLARARAHRDDVMPVYTHYQAAMPITYGYYLLGVGLAIGRDIDALRMASAGLAVCPLGANAVAGTDLPIDPARTAQLLGFDATTVHALDSVASRDVVLRLLGAAAGVSIVLSRLATDFQLWSTVEFAFLDFPDRLVGGSSAMPQKRNAFLLEHIKAKAGHVVGAWAGAAAMMANTPFTNSIEVGTEALAALWPGLRACDEAVLLSQVVASGGRPSPERMLARAQEGFTTATAVANRLVSTGTAFRTAHHQVGEAVRRAVQAGSTDLAQFGPPGWLDDLGLDGLDVSDLIREQRHGGGPGAFDEPFDLATTAWSRRREWQRDWRRTVAAADDLLAEAVSRHTRLDGGDDGRGDGTDDGRGDGTDDGRGDGTDGSGDGGGTGPAR